MFPSLVFDHHSELETKPPVSSSGEADWNFQVCSRQSERTLGQQTPPPPDKHTGEAMSQDSRCTEQNRVGVRVEHSRPKAWDSSRRITC